MNVKQLFHYISYLQYPLMLMALYFVLTPYFNGLDKSKESVDVVFNNLNNVLVFMGLGISFSTLQDTTKTQNKLSQRIWEDPVKGKLALFFMSLMTFLFIITGLIGYFSSQESKLKDLSIGIIIMGIGLIGLLKTAIEMFENNRKDKKSISREA